MFKVVKNFVVLQNVLNVFFVDKVLINKYQQRVKCIDYLTQLHLTNFIKFYFIFINKIMY